jgi:hypothetical protein
VSGETANGDRGEINERGDREAVIAVAIGNLDLGNRSSAPEGTRSPWRTGAIE